MSERDDEKLFPMMDPPIPIPWLLAERIYWDLYVPNFGEDQTLERIAERGGFGWGEILTYAKMLAVVRYRWRRGEAKGGV